MTVKELLEKESFYDAAIIRHGFTDYMRDYDIIVKGSRSQKRDDVHRYQFVGCCHADYETRVRPEVFTASLPDDYVYSGPDYPEKDDPPGFIWGVRYSSAFPGLAYIDDSPLAQKWASRLGREMHEISLETEAFHLRLIFAEVRYTFLGTVPQVVLKKDYPVAPQET